MTPTEGALLLAALLLAALLLVHSLRLELVIRWASTRLEGDALEGATQRERALQLGEAVQLLRTENAQLQATQRELVHRITLMQQQGLVALPLAGEADDEQAWAIDNEHELAVQRARTFRRSVEGD